MQKIQQKLGQSSKTMYLCTVQKRYKESTTIVLLLCLDCCNYSWLLLVQQ